MQEPPSLDLLNLNNDISITPSRRRRHDILIERKGYEDNDNQKIYNSANGAHGFGAVVGDSKPPYPTSRKALEHGNPHLIRPGLCHVSAFESSSDEGTAQPSY